MHAGDGVLTPFEAATAVTPLRDGAYGVTIDGAWAVGERPNGGYLLAAMARAGLDVAAPHADHPHVLSAAAQYQRAPASGEAEIRVELARAGRLASHVVVTLGQGGRDCVRALLTLGRLDAGARPAWQDAPPAELPPLESCPRLPLRRSRVPMPLWDVLAIHADPATLGWAHREPSGDAESRGWIARADGGDPDPLWLLVALDSLPAVTLELGSRGWVPTLELTAYTRALPAPGPVRARQRARLVQDGLVDETCEIWDARGRLVAQSMQLAATRLGT